MEDCEDVAGNDDYEFQAVDPDSITGQSKRDGLMN